MSIHLVKWKVLKIEKKSCNIMYSMILSLKTKKTNVRPTKTFGERQIFSRGEKI